jgi:hypothetical protein
LGSGDRCGGMMRGDVFRNFGTWSDELLHYIS